MERGVESDERVTARRRVFRAPGRVNLIGEYTDFNDGFVMPAAIDFATSVAISPRKDRVVSVYSENFGEAIEFDLDEREPRAARHWSDYVRGVAVVLERSGYRLLGADLAVRGDVPIGSGLSSSAAFEVASGYALLANSGHRLPPAELAKLCQRAENEFVGMRCGIMDQFISCAGQAGKALLLDCRSLEFKLLPLPAEVRLVICNTMVKHELASSEYNMRRTECEEGAHYFAQNRSNALALRDVTRAELERSREDLPEVVYRRCRHVISENARVLEAAGALEATDLEAFGQLMSESHRSLRDDYEVSCKELDLIVELAAQSEGVYGTRMTGAGFGGCTISLVKSENVEEFQEHVTQNYRERTGYTPEIYVCDVARGVEEVTNV